MWHGAADCRGARVGRRPSRAVQARDNGPRDALPALQPSGQAAADAPRPLRRVRERTPEDLECGALAASPLPRARALRGYSVVPRHDTPCAVPLLSNSTGTHAFLLRKQCRGGVQRRGALTCRVAPPSRQVGKLLRAVWSLGWVRGAVGARRDGSRVGRGVERLAGSVGALRPLRERERCAAALRAWMCAAGGRT
eukprot:3412442-Prymnesium_polylepis.2